MEEELRELLANLERRPGAHDRSLLVEQIGDLCFSWNAKLDARELEHVFAIVESLVEQAETHVRCKLSEHLSARNDVPHDLLLFLAGDEIDVAYPVLVWSKLLTDDDLIGLVANMRATTIWQLPSVPRSTRWSAKRWCRPMTRKWSSHC